jgi:hypothetical protein
MKIEKNVISVENWYHRLFTLSFAPIVPRTPIPFHLIFNTCNEKPASVRHRPENSQPAQEEICKKKKEKNQASRRKPSSIERKASDTAAAPTAERSQVVLTLTLAVIRFQRELRVFPGSLKLLRINHNNSLLNTSSSSPSPPL